MRLLQRKVEVSKINGEQFDFPVSAIRKDNLTFKTSTKVKETNIIVKTIKDLLRKANHQHLQNSQEAVVFV